MDPKRRGNLACKSKKRARTSFLIALLFIIIALIGLAYSPMNSKPPPPTPQAGDLIHLEHELALQRDNLDFHRKLWLEKLDGYRAIAQIAAKIAEQSEHDKEPFKDLLLMWGGCTRQLIASPKKPKPRLPRNNPGSGVRLI
jgi:hypothetical protein